MSSPHCHGDGSRETDGSLVYEDPGELVAAIPGLLRFTPVDSVVLVTYADDGGGPRRLEAVLRMDLPEPAHVAEVARQLRLVAVNHDATVVEVVVLGGGTLSPSGPPHRDLITALTSAFDCGAVTCVHTIWAPSTSPDETWRCYDDPSCGGRIGNPAELDGGVAFISRAELAAQLAPDSDDVLARRVGLLATQPVVDPTRDIPFLRDTIDAINPEADLALDDETIVRLAHSLAHVDVREVCLAFALTVRATAAEKLWTTLIRAAPLGVRAEPAAQLAVCAYLRGEGALAGVALDVALAANSQHGLAGTVRQIMDVGLPPHKFRTLLIDSFIAAYSNRSYNSSTGALPAAWRVEARRRFRLVTTRNGDDDILDLRSAGTIGGE